MRLSGRTASCNDVAIIHVFSHAGVDLTVVLGAHISRKFLAASSCLSYLCRTNPLPSSCLAHVSTATASNGRSARESWSLAEHVSVCVVCGLYILIDSGGDVELQPERSSRALLSQLKRALVRNNGDSCSCRRRSNSCVKNSHLP